jgi:arsenate reductase-like glutaredoxin family protein
MNIQIFGTNKCRDTQKAVRFFKERGLSFHFVDLDVKPLSKGELRNICITVKLEDLIDKDGQQFKKRNLQYIDYDIENEILADPKLLKTPIIRIGNISMCGFFIDKINQILK